MSYFKLYEAKRNKNKHLNVGELWQWIELKNKFNTICITKIENDLVYYRYLFGHLSGDPIGFHRPTVLFKAVADPLCQKVDCHTT